MEVSLFLFIHPDPDIFRTDSSSVLRVNYQHSHPIKAFFAPGNRIAAQSVRQNMADLGFSTAAAGLFTHTDNNGTPVIGTILNKIPDLLLFLLHSLFTEYSLTVLLKSLI